MTKMLVTFLRKSRCDYSAPVICATAEHCKEMLQATLEQIKIPADKVSDIEVYHIGYFDSDTGVMKALEKKAYLMCGSDVINEMELTIEEAGNVGNITAVQNQITRINNEQQ